MLQELKRRICDVAEGMNRYVTTCLPGSELQVQQLLSHISVHIEECLLEKHQNMSNKIISFINIFNILKYE